MTNTATTRTAHNSFLRLIQKRWMLGADVFALLLLTGKSWRLTLDIL